MKDKSGINVLWKVVAEFLVMILVFIFFVSVSDRRDFGEAIRSITDVTTLIGLILIIVPGMMISGHCRDFCLAFTVGKKQYSLMKLKNIAEAVGAFQRYVALAAVIEIAVQVIIVCNFVQGSASDINIVFPNLALISISAVYASVLELLVIPIKSNVIRMINKELDFDEEQSYSN